MFERRKRSSKTYFAPWRSWKRSVVMINCRRWWQSALQLCSDYVYPVSLSLNTLHTFGNPKMVVTATSVWWCEVWDLTDFPSPSVQSDISLWLLSFPRPMKDKLLFKQDIFQIFSTTCFGSRPWSRAVVTSYYGRGCKLVTGSIPKTKYLLKSNTPYG